MAWLIQRRAPQEPTAFWGKADRWVIRRPAGPAAETPAMRVPEGTAVYQDWDVAQQVAEWLRTNQPLAYGEVIALDLAPEGLA